MKNIWIVLLVVLIAAGAFLIGRRSGDTVATVAVPASSPEALALAKGEKPKHDQSAPTEPVRTYRGPDGRAYIIVYDEKNPPDSDNPEQVRKALLSDMRFYPTNIERNYDLAAQDVKAMLAGTKPIPDFMLPEPPKPGAKK